MSSMSQIGSLNSIQRAIDIISNNIANANTDYFSRTDSIYSDKALGGLNISSVIRFDPQLATKINQLISQQSKSSYLSSSQNSLQSSLSGLNTTVLDSINSIKNAFSQLDTSPDDVSSKTVASESLRSVSDLLNTSLDDLDASKANISSSKFNYMESLNDKLKSLSEFNKKSVEYRTSSEGLTFANQLVQSIGELAGGSPRFNEDASITYTIGNAPIMDDTTSQLVNSPGFVISGGLIGGMNQAMANIDSARTQLQQSMAAFSSTINMANTGGTTTAGAVGGSLFNLTPAGKLVYLGSPAALATHSPTGATFGSRMTNGLNNLSNGMATIAATQGVKYQGYESETTLYKASFNSAVTEYATKNGVDPDLEAVKLAAAQKHFEAMAKVISVQSSLTGTIINITA